VAVSVKNDLICRYNVKKELFCDDKESEGSIFVFFLWNVGYTI